MTTENQTTDLPSWRPTGIGYSEDGPLGPPILQEVECITKDSLITVRVRLQYCRVFIHATVTWGSRAVGPHGGQRTVSWREETWELPPRDEWGDAMDVAKEAALDLYTRSLERDLALWSREPLTGQELADERGQGQV